MRRLKLWRGARAPWAAFLVVALLAAGVAFVRTRTSEAAPTTASRVLAISANGQETDWPAITASLDRYGVPYDTLVGTQTELTQAMLVAPNGQGRYSGIVLTTGDLGYLDPGTNTWQSAFSSAEWGILWGYQTAFAVRSVTSFTYPDASNGLTYVGFQDTLVTPTAATVTAAGQQVFTNLVGAAPLQLAGAWLYLGTAVNPAATTPLVTATINGQTYPVASVTTFPDGRQNLAVTIANNPNLAHTKAFAFGWIQWVTKGIFTGVLSYEAKVLAVAADGNETDWAHLTGALDRIGVPYDTLIAKDSELTPATLADTMLHGKYSAILLTTGNLTYFDAGANAWLSAFTPDEWSVLHAYQIKFGVRSVTSFTYPEAAYGLTYVGFRDTTTTALPATITTAGRQAFPYLSTTGGLRFSGAWLYLGNVINATATTPLITTRVGTTNYPVLAVNKSDDGRQNLVSTVANNGFLTHSLTLSYAVVDWATKGLFLGAQRASLNAQIDDLFIDDDMWNTVTNTSGPQTYRNSPADITALVNWQNTRRANPNTPGLKVEWAFNALGSEPGEYANDTLTPAVQANKAQFGFINHTYSHFNLDCGDCADPTGQITTTPAQIQQQITQNITRATQLGLTSDWDTMVQPDISGINTPPNPMAQQAAANAGIRFWIGDPSRPGQANPSFNTGFYTAGDSRLYVVPRWANNLFFSVSNQAQWVDMYNYFYGPGGILCGQTTCFSTNQTYAQIVNRESDQMLRYLLKGDLNPLMFHTPNVRAYNGVNSTMTDVLGQTLDKYNALMRLPVRSLSFKQVGLAQQERGIYNGSGVSATIRPCVSITVRTVNAVKAPLTGVAYNAANSTVESYGGKTISNINLGAGQSVTVPLAPC